MTQDNKILAIIADPSPVIAAGLAQCLRRLQGFTAGSIEVKNADELFLRTRTSCPDFILVNPSFGGLFNPVLWKRDLKLPHVKILAIEIGKLNPETAGLFDGVISVMDNLETIARKLQSLRETVDNSRDKDSLSIREKEIISLVVRGLTNQEIADKLFLSIHTVITHRRNIARKLEIHSATGLTIYAIVNKIVDIADIKL